MKKVPAAIVAITGTMVAITGTIASAPAYAYIDHVTIYEGYVWFHDENGGWTGIALGWVLALAVAAFLVACALKYVFNDADSRSTGEVARALDEAERIEEHARILRAKQQYTDAHTNLRYSQIEKARADAVYDELPQIKKHDREVRHVTRRL